MVRGGTRFAGMVGILMGILGLEPSVPIPKFASLRGTLVCELRREARAFRKTGIHLPGRALTRAGHGLAQAFRLLPEHVYEQASVDNLHREGLQRNDDGSSHRCA